MTTASNNPKFLTIPVAYTLPAASLLTPLLIPRYT